MSRPSRLEIVPLGGLGEFGMNAMLYRLGTDCLLVDAGMMFPGVEHPGVELIIPDFSFLEDCGRLHALILTHGHEDHIGALPYLLSRRELPIYASAYTRELARGRLEEHGLKGARLESLPEEGQRLTLGPFEIEFLATAHSIPQAKMLLIRTPLGTLLHTADFKMDPDSPDGICTDRERLAALGREGVLALLSDSTNADQPGFTRGERSVTEAIEAVVADSPQRVLVTTFASNVQRLRELVEIAVRQGRRLALLGASLRTHAEIAQRLGLLHIPEPTRVKDHALAGLPRQRVLIVATGSQGERASALSRIALGKHRDIQLEAGDRVIHSARVIPGNAPSIGRMIDRLLRLGVEVISGADAPVHVSGHPSREELRLMIQLTQPRFLIPIHGEYRQLRAHAELGLECGLPAERVLVAESGDRITLDQDLLEVSERVPVGRIFIDATLSEVERGILRDRRRIAGDGIVVPVIAIDRRNGSFVAGSEIMTRGFVTDVCGNEEGVMSEARQIVDASLAGASEGERGDDALLRSRVEADLRRFLRRRTRRRPLVIPVIVEL